MFRMFMILALLTLGCSSAVSQVSTTGANEMSRAPAMKYVPTDAEQKLVAKIQLSLVSPLSCDDFAESLVRFTWMFMDWAATCERPKEAAWCAATDEYASESWALRGAGFKERCQSRYSMLLIYDIWLSQATHDCCSGETFARVRQKLLP